MTDQYGVPFLAVGGFASATRTHELAERSQQDERPLIILYVGDWDPSGLFMSNSDLPGRIERYGGVVEIRRIALAAEDIEHGDLPWFSVEEKRKDPRYSWFLENFGQQCFELDAMDPRDLRDRVEEAIREYIDWPAWKRAELAEEAELWSLREVMGQWVDAVEREAEEEQICSGTDLLAEPPPSRFRRLVDSASTRRLRQISAAPAREG